MSFKPQVQTDSSGKWYGNALAFATEAEALDNAADLMGRWMLVRDYRVIASDEPVNYTYINHELKELKETPA